MICIYINNDFEANSASLMSNGLMLIFFPSRPASSMVGFWQLLLPESITEKLLHEKFDLHGSHDDKCFGAEGTLVKKNLHLATRVKEHGTSPSAIPKHWDCLEKDP